MKVFSLTLLGFECFRDLLKCKYPVYSNEVHIKAGIDWLCRAQNISDDNGVSAWFSLVNGWQPSYIETTGYIINTFLDVSKKMNQPELKKRAIKMADFLILMQHELGGYRTAVPSRGAKSVPTVFNTGQDLLGLTDVYTLTKNRKYLHSATRAADFLLSIQESDGSWLKYTYGMMKHTYHTRVAWGILKVWQISGKKKYLNAAKKNLSWAEKQQQKNGWFTQNHLPLPNPKVPYTHTIAYAIEGFLWSGLILKNQKYLDIAAKGALPLANYYLCHDLLPGTFDQDWKSRDEYTCLTGDAQMALIWLELYKVTHKVTFLEAAQKMLLFLKSTQPTGSTVHLDIRGGIKGSLPIFGDILHNSGYCRLAYLNWSTKFFLDALLVEDQIIKLQK